MRRLLSRLNYQNLSRVFGERINLVGNQKNAQQRATMSSQNKFSPPVNRQMISLDRSFFEKKVPLLVAAFPDPRNLGEFVKACKGDILLKPGVKHIVPVNGTRGVLLRVDIDCLENYEERLSPAALKKLKMYDASVLPYTLSLDYSFWKADEILNSILPEHLTSETPTGYAQAGHIAHLNLRKEFKEYGPLIGQVIMDKNPKIETVVDKMDTIDTKFRTFKMKILAGKDDFVVEQNESGCTFKFDFSSVYWNSRLSTEHDRLISQFHSGGVVVDVFAGVGPFAVPAGRKNAFVLANDLNPESYKYLRENIQLNNVKEFVIPYNLDGRQLIRESPSMLLKWANSVGSVEERKRVKRRKSDTNNGKIGNVRVPESTKFEIPKFISNYVMNLPDSALTFLDEFIGLYTRDDEVEELARNDPNFQLPMINVHCFEKFSIDDPEPSMEELHKRVHSRIVKIINFPLSFDECHFHLVRKVAPTKPMFCVTFRLPREVAFKTTK